MASDLLTSGAARLVGVAEVRERQDAADGASELARLLDPTGDVDGVAAFEQEQADEGDDADDVDRSADLFGKDFLHGHSSIRKGHAHLPGSGVPSIPGPYGMLASSNPPAGPGV